MSFKTPLLFALALAAGSASAADVPYQAAFEPATQLKAMSVQHWTVIADDLAMTTLASLGDRANTGVYIAPAAGTSRFDQALHTFLVNSFHKAGAKVYTVPTDGALTINVDSLVTTHKSKADQMPPMMGTVLTAGVLVVRDIALSNWKAGLLALSASQDLARPYEKTVSRTELAVTVSVADKDKVYAARQSNIYYLDNADAHLFRNAGKTLRIQGDN